MAQRRSPAGPQVAIGGESFMRHIARNTSRKRSLFWFTPTGSNTSDGYEGLYTRVLQAVTCGQGGRMPKGIVVGEDAQDVASFVAAYAGQIDKGPTVDTATAPKPEPPSC